MSNYVSIPEILLLVALLPSGAILFLVGRKVIEQMDLCRGRRADVMAFSISFLIVASIATLLLVPNSATEDEHNRLRVFFSYLSAVAVAGTVILLQIFVVVATRTPDRSDEVPARESVHKFAKPKPAGRPKKEKAVKKDSKQASTPVSNAS